MADVDPESVTFSVLGKSINHCATCVVYISTTRQTYCLNQPRVKDVRTSLKGQDRCGMHWSRHGSRKLSERTTCCCLVDIKTSPDKSQIHRHGKETSVQIYILTDTHHLTPLALAVLTAVSAPFLLSPPTVFSQRIHLPTGSSLYARWSIKYSDPSEGSLAAPLLFVI